MGCLTWEDVQEGGEHGVKLVKGTNGGLLAGSDTAAKLLLDVWRPKVVGTDHFDHVPQLFLLHTSFTYRLFY